MATAVVVEDNQVNTKLADLFLLLLNNGELFSWCELQLQSPAWPRPR